MNLLPPDLVRGLVDCVDEPIRVPGAIQPHGWMIAIDAASAAVVAYSENWQHLAGAAGVASNTAVHDEALAAVVASLRPKLVDVAPNESPASVGTVVIAGQTLAVTVHRSGSLLLLEFEPASPDTGTQAPIYSLARHFLPQLRKASSVPELASLAAAEIKRLTGFGRCLAYRFDSEGHGEVLGEALTPGYDSYLGHRFPAMDIPAQARALYCLNHIRLIPDANYEPVALRCVDSSVDPRTLDLSFASLRSVSPIHLEYMRNMRTLASMSVSIIVRGRLWGLISGHNHEPRQLEFESRVACEHLGRLLSVLIEANEDKAEIAARFELRKLIIEIVSHLAHSDASLQQLIVEPGPLLHVVRACGAAVILDDQCWSTGDTPPPEQIQALASWIGQLADKAYQTHSLAEVFAPAAHWKEGPAGMLAISLSQVHRHLIVWFRPEIVETIQWAGEPRKALASDGPLHPRRSFATWEQLVVGKSTPWTPSETAAALELRQALISIVLQRAEERAEVATELGRVNKELEAFSYSVSHDLRAPMRQITSYVDLVLDTEGEKISERAHRYLGQAKEASAFAGQLVDALLDFSRMGRSELKRSQVDTEKLVDDLIAELGGEDSDRNVEWKIERPLPALWADPFLMQVAVRNLFGNALKYTRKRQTARIRVTGLSRPDGTRLEVSDDGVGFEMKYVAKLFGVFQRLHSAEEFEGTGIGLANVRRIVERHGGVTWARGEPGVGATFGFLIPHQPAAEVPPWTERSR